MLPVAHCGRQSPPKRHRHQPAERGVDDGASAGDFIEKTEGAQLLLV